MSKGVQLALAVASVVVALVWILQSSEGAFVYFHNVSEMRAKLALQNASGDTGSQPGLRVQGFVVNGSIERNLDQATVRFAIQDDPVEIAAADSNQTTPVAVSNEAGPETLAVLYQGIDLPDLFTDGAMVVVEGQLAGDLFLAQRVMAKCPSKYENAPAENAGISILGVALGMAGVGAAQRARASA